MRDPILDLTMLVLATGNFITFRAPIESGLIILSELGSGKSSTSARMIALAFLRASLGGLVLTVKSDETAHFTEYTRQTGREKDLIIFNAASGLSFDSLAYIWNVGGRAAAQIETVVEIFTVLMSVGKVYQPSSGERYFEQAVEELMRVVLTILSNAGERIAINSLHQVISSLPVERKQVNDPEWQTTSEC